MLTFVRHISMPLYGSQLPHRKYEQTSSARTSDSANFRHIIMQRKFHGIAEANGFPASQKSQDKLVAGKNVGTVLYRIFWPTMWQTGF
jgi:hypothetical protein